MKRKVTFLPAVPLWPATSLVATPALAEVCDKAVGDSWRPSHGPVWLLNLVDFPFALTILLSGLFLVAVLRLPWLGYLAAALLLLNVAATVFWDLIPEHEVYRMELREGCRSYQTDLMDIGLMSALAFAYVWLGRRKRPIRMTQTGES